MRARGLTAPLSREGSPSYREAKGGDVQPVPLVLLKGICSGSPTAWPGAPSFSRTLRKGGYGPRAPNWGGHGFQPCRQHHKDSSRAVRSNAPLSAIEHV